jgi:hypothetical protein
MSQHLSNTLGWLLVIGYLETILNHYPLWILHHTCNTHVTMVLDGVWQ